MYMLFLLIHGFKAKVTVLNSSIFNQKSIFLTAQDQIVEKSSQLQKYLQGIQALAF